VIEGWGLLPVATRATRPGRMDFEGAAFDLKGLALAQGQGHLAAGLGDDALKGGAGDTHAPGCLLLS
jgi:hypothetical protein